MFKKSTGQSYLIAVGTHPLLFTLHFLLPVLIYIIFILCDFIYYIKIISIHNTLY